MKLPNQQSNFLEQNIGFAEWQCQVIKYRDLFSKRNEKNWLLFEQDSYLFSLLFFALLSSKKKIILPQNGQKLQLEQSMAHADIFVGSQHSSSLKYFDISPHTNESDANNCIAEEIEFSEDNEVVFFTSGSSGEPKAITKTINQLLIEAETLENIFGATKGLTDKSEIVMSTVSHQHIYGLLFKLIWPIWAGKDIYLKTFQYPEHLVYQVKQYPNRNIRLISSPAYYHRLVKDNLLVQIKSQLTTLFSSGGPLNHEVALRLDSELGNAPIEVLGSTETGGIAWRKRDHKNDESWLPFETIEIKVEKLTKRLSILSPYASHELNSAQNNWFMTDDRAELINDAQQGKNLRFNLLGRADRIVKIEEKRCSLDEIQMKLLQHEWIEQCYILTVGGKNDKRLTTAAVVELSVLGTDALKSSNKFKFDQQLKNYLKDYFEAIVVPRKFRHLTSLPFNSQGKLNKAELEALFG